MRAGRSILILLVWAASAVADVPQSRLDRLAVGINKGEWFRFRPREEDPGPELAVVRGAGFRHIRLCVGQGLVFDPNQPRRIPPENLLRLHRMIEAIHAADLAVVVVIHDTDHRLWSDEKYLDAFCVFWTALAKELARHDPEMLYLENVNEPHADEPAAWNWAYPRILAAMREGSQGVVVGVEKARDSGQMLDQILQSAEAVSAQLRQVSAAVRQINTASAEMGSAMESVSAVVEQNTAATEEMSAGSKEVSESLARAAQVSARNAQSIESVSAATEELNAQAEELMALSRTMDEMAQHLIESVQRFRLT